MRKKYLIIGAGGRIGTYLVSKLISKGNFVRAVSRRKIVNLLYPSESIEMGLTPDSDFDNLLKDMDIVIYLGDGFNRFEGVAPSSRVNKDAFVLLLTLQNFMDSIKKHEVELIYLSSIKSMCGNYSNEVLTEQSENNPKCLYGQLKLSAERLILEATHGTSIDVSIIRIPVVFGLQSIGNLNFLDKIVQTHLPLPLKNINARRSFIKIDSLVSALTTIANSEKRGREVYLLHDDSISVKELVQHLNVNLDGKIPMFSLPKFLWRMFCLLPIIGEKVERVFKPLEINDAKFRHQFNWQPTSKNSLLNR